MDDRIEFTAPLPDNALAATVTFKAAKPGRDRTVPRADATYAELQITGLDGKVRSRRVELAEADAFVREAQAIHARDRAFSAAAAQRGDAAAHERAARSAALVPRCPYCDMAREHQGRRNLVSLGVPEQLARPEELGRSRPETRPYEEYACPRCGSVELFRAGVLDHPLG